MVTSTICRSRVAGCAGLVGDLCPRIGGYCNSLVSGALCRLGHLALPGDANATCGRHGMHDEWEPVALQQSQGNEETARSLDGNSFAGVAPLTLIGMVGAGGGAGCPKSLPASTSVLQGEMAAPSSEGQGLPRYSEHDNCFTHRDRDFAFDLAVGEEALPYLSPANMTSDRNHAGRDLEIETEWMYFFPPFRSTWLFSNRDRGLARPQSLGSRISFAGAGGAPQELAVPAPGDVLAAQGVLIADCGYLDGRGFARTELHPALALTWVHSEGGGRFSLHVRAASHLASDVLRFPLAPLSASLPIAGAAGRRAELVSFNWDYLWRGYSIETDRSCVLSANGAHEQERPTAHLSSVDQSDVAAANASHESPNAMHQLGGFSLRLLTSGDHVLVELRALRDEDPPLLVGASAELVLR
jgi:hypothetical protein